MTITRDSIIGRIFGKLGFRIVSESDFNLLNAVKNELLPSLLPAQEDFLPRNMLGHSGFAINLESQLALLDSFAQPDIQALFTHLRRNPEVNTGYMGRDFSTQDLIHNGFFPSPDAELYAAMIATARPGMIIEIGSGFSTVIARTAVNRIGITCPIHVFDPEPRRNITDYADHIEYTPVEKSTLVNQIIPENTLLFIDSSHVCRSGGDLPFLYCTLLPSLPDNVLVHIHDIFTPYDYPDNYYRRFYTEEYLLSALLAHSNRFEIVFMTHFMTRQHPDPMRRVFGDGVGRDPLFYGSSFYVRTRG